MSLHPNLADMLFLEPFRPASGFYCHLRQIILASDQRNGRSIELSGLLA